MLARKRKPDHKKATTTAFTIVFDGEDRFVPCPVKADYKTKHQATILHPIFLLKSQAEEYVKERLEAGFWRQDTRIVVVEIEINEK